MSKKFIITGLLFVGVLFVQTSTQAQTQNSLPELPSAGLTPNSPLYFLERAAESIGEFLTFDTEMRARLQAERALERIAEVKAMLSEKDINPKGLNIALDKLQVNIAKAAEIIQQEQQKGKNVSVLAKELDTDFELRERMLKQILGEKVNQVETTFKQQKTNLKKQLLDAKIAEDSKKIGEIKLALDTIEQEKEAQKFLLEQEEKELGVAFDIEEEKFERALEEKERELELKEEEAGRALEQRKEEIERQFEEAGRALEREEESLEDQFDIAISLGDAGEIEKIKAQLLEISGETESLDSKLEDSEREIEKVERNFEILILKEERSLEDFTKQEELALKKSEIEIEKASEEKERALKSKFRTEESALELQEKQLELQISEARQACELAPDQATCLTETVTPLKESQVQVEIQKQQLEIQEKQSEQALELEKKQMEQVLDLKEKELELREKEQEQTLETKEEEFKKLQTEKERQLEQQDKEAGRGVEQEREPTEGQKQTEQGETVR